MVVKKGDGAPPAPSGASLTAGRGDEQVPDFALVNQDGKRVQLGAVSRQGRPAYVHLHALPAAGLLPADDVTTSRRSKRSWRRRRSLCKTHLLSISFDPKYDTPEVLRNYASAFVADQEKQTFEHWEFASILEPERADITRVLQSVLQRSGRADHALAEHGHHRARRARLPLVLR